MMAHGADSTARHAFRGNVLNEIPVESVVIACGYTDMRRSIDGLAALVKQSFRLDPCSRTMYLFCGRRSDRLKALLWEGDGFLLLYKRLETGRFQWPRRESDARAITTQQLRWLLEGLSVEQPRALRRVESVMVV